MTAQRNSLLLLALATLAVPATAEACGGFFCGAVFDPVVQTAERILFRVNPDDTVTSVIEIQYEGEPTDFAWVLPLSAPIDPQSVSTASAGLFDALEDLTAPRFVTGFDGATADVAGMSAAGCSAPWWFYGPNWQGGMESEPFVPDFSGVEVVGDSVVGPYAIEVITAEDAGTLLSWLNFNGYQLPGNAQEAIASYVGDGGAFLGVKLNPDVPAGPIDALEVTMPGTAPSLPLMLTAVAAADDMDITAYVLADERYAPDNYVDYAFDWSRVQWAGEGRTDYEDRIPSEVDALGGRAFLTEFAGRTDSLPLVDGPTGKEWDDEVTPLQSASALLETGAYLSRFRTKISPDEMTEDPVWLPAPELGDVSNEHAIGSNDALMASLPVWLLAALGLGLARRRV